MGLGVCKIALFVALGFGYTLPDFGLFSPLPTKSESINVPTSAPSTPTASPVAIAPNDADAASQKSIEPTSAPSTTPPQAVATAPAQKDATTPVAPAAASTMPKAAPQGSDAVRAALAHKSTTPLNDTIPNTTPQNTHTAPQNSTIAAVYNAPKAQIPAAEDTSWWGDIFDIKSLPIPRLGVDQVAYAATLDAPPPPPPAPNTNSTPFTPPAQSNAVRPAGTTGPQMQGGGSIPPYNPLVPNANPPAPNVNAYVPPEDPNQKEQELTRREQEILALKQQMEQRLQELQRAERQVQDMLKEAKNVENQKMQGLTNMYVNMKPRQAGAALEKLDENIAAKILMSMKAKQAGEILSYMDPTKTAKLTELLTRMRLGQ